MLQKIVFQDNIYQLSRSIDTVYEGLLLDLSDEFFFDKTVDDLLFFDVSIQKLFKYIQVNDQVAGYSNILQSLYTCQSRYIQLIESLIQGNAGMKEKFAPLIPKLCSIRDLHYSQKSELSKKIQKTDKNSDSHEIVSQNELSELLNF